MTARLICGRTTDIQGFSSCLGLRSDRGELFSSPLTSSQSSSLGCNSLPNSQPESSQQEVSAAPPETALDPPAVAELTEEKSPEPSAPNSTRPPPLSQQTPDDTITSSPSNKVRQPVLLSPSRTGSLLNLQNLYVLCASAPSADRVPADEP